MKKILLSLVAGSFLMCNASEFSIDKAHSSVNFNIKHMMISKATGVFKSFDATIDYDEKENKFLVLNASVDVNSVDTNNATRDNHIKAEDFLNSKNNPNMTFVMTKYEKKDNDEGKMYGTLTINGVSKDVVFDVDINGIVTIKDKTKLGFEMETKINRLDFNIAKTTGDNMLSEIVNIKIYVEADKK